MSILATLPVLQDRFTRVHTYLRVSVTDRCNFRCLYCMPVDFAGFAPRAELLTYEEIVHVVGIAAEMGITRIRLTGGEPLVRRDLVGLVAALHQVPGIEELSLTSNGQLMRRFAPALHAAGLDRVNISLDTLRPDRFRQIARGGDLATVLDGIEAAREAGLDPVKINVVALKGVNDDEVVEFARLTLAGWHVRFIELMPFPEEQNEDCHGGGLEGAYLSTEDMRARIEALGPLEAAEVAGNGPARTWRLPGASGTLGFISPVSEEHFCQRCNRLRLTADGKLRPCLLQDEEVDLRAPLRSGASRDELRQVFRETVAGKRESHRLLQGVLPNVRHMSQIGG